MGTSPIIQLLSRLAEEAGPAVEGELGSVAPASAFRALTSEETPIGTRAYVQKWLQKLLGASGESNPAASILRSQGPTNAPPGAPAAQAAPQVAPSPARPLKMQLQQKLEAYAPYGREYGEAAKVPYSETTGALTPSIGQPDVTGNAPGPTAPAPMSPPEMLQRPAGPERQEMLGRLQDYLSQYKEGDTGVMPALKRLRAVFQPQASALPPEVKAGLSRTGALPSEELPQPSGDTPVTRFPYRGAPRQGTANVPPEEAFRSEGLKQTKLPPDMQEMLSQLVKSGQLPGDVLSSENTTRALLAKLSGYKPRALLGGNKTIGEASSSRVGLMLQRFSELSPEEITRVLSQVKPSGIYRLGRIQEAAEQAAPSYQALGEPGSVEEIVSNLLRGGPKPSGTSPFSEKALGPILKKRQQQGLPQGTPLSLDDVMQTLRGGANKFIRASQPAPARQQLLEKVLQMMKERGAK